MKVRPHAAGLYPLLDPDWRRKTRHAGKLLFIPVVGWPMVLGYRRALIDHLFGVQPEAMPEWRGRYREHFLNGVRAMGVIQGYLAPLWIALVVLASPAEGSDGRWMVWLGCATLMFPLISNLAFAISLTVLGTELFGPPALTPSEGATLGTLFHIAIFLVPAGFMRVTTTGRFLSAFNLRRTISFIARHPRGYLAAWWYGLWMNLPAVPLAVIAPWSVFWAYVASLVIFNQLLPQASPTSGDEPRPWISKAEDTAPPGTRVWRTPFTTVPLP